MPGGRRPRRPGGALAAVLAVALAGCATPPPRVPPVPGGVAPGEVDGLVRRWEAEWQEFPGLRAAVDLTVVRRGSPQRTAGVLLVSPTHLRFEATTPLGFPALVAIVGPERLLVVSLVEQKAWSARPTPEALGRWLGFPLPPETIIRLLVGYVPSPPPGVPLRLGEDRGPHLVFSQGRLTERVWVTTAGQPARLELDDGRRITTTFERAMDGGVHTLAVEAPAHSLEVHLRYISREYALLPPEAFALSVPPGITVQSVD